MSDIVDLAAVRGREDAARTTTCSNATIDALKADYDGLKLGDDCPVCSIKVGRHPPTVSKASDHSSSSSSDTSPWSLTTEES